MRAADGGVRTTIASNHFIGELSFLSTMQDLKKDATAKPSKASCSVLANNKVVVLEWDSRKLASALEKDRDLSNAFASYCSHDLRKKLLSANAEGDKSYHAKQTGVKRYDNDREKSLQT